ncbi:MAG: TrkA family potassium uptake protein [Chloroflexi bacterium]|nr:TrkA family potassium uptake protein [Chloroflexota bacterium]
MKVIIIGCGRLGVEVAYRLYQNGHDVAIVDNIPAAFHMLPPDFQGRTVEGEALDQNVLYRAGIETADGLAALTNQDSLNAVVGYLARTVYNIPNVVVRNYDPQARQLYEAFGLQVISSTIWGAKRIEDLLLNGELKTVFSAGNGEVEFYEFVIPEELEGLKVGELLAPGESLPSSLTRSGRAILPKPDTQVHAGDVIHFSATPEGIDAIRKLLRKKTEA